MVTEPFRFNKSATIVSGGQILDSIHYVLNGVAYSLSSECFETFPGYHILNKDHLGKPQEL